MRIAILLLFWLNILNSGGYARVRYYQRLQHERLIHNLIGDDEERHATIAIRIGRRGLNFFSIISNKILEKEVPRIRFPPLSFPISGGPGSGSAQVQDLQIRKFSSPDFTFALEPPDRVLLRSTNGAAKIRGNWSAEYTLITTVSTSGWVEAFVSDIRSSLTASVYGENGRPQVKIIDCNVALGSFSLEIGGGVIPWLVNLFRGDLSDLIKEEVHAQFCTTARTTLIEELNEQLLSLPSHLPVADPIYVKYEYTDNPIVKNNEIVYPAYLDVTVGNRSCGTMSPYPDPMPPLEPPQPRNHYMSTLWIAPSIFQCLADSIYAANLTHLVIDQDFDGGKFATFLSAKCAFYEVCLGKFLPKFASEYPNEHMALHFHSARPASVNVTMGHIDLDTDTFVDFHISPYNKNPKILARIELKANLSINPKIMDDRISGILNENMDLIFSKVFSHIGDIHESVLNLFAAMFGPVLRIMVNAQLRIGLPVPLIENIAVDNDADFSTLDGGVTRIDADLYYVNDAINEFRQL